MTAGPVGRKRHRSDDAKFTAEVLSWARARVGIALSADPDRREVGFMLTGKRFKLRKSALAIEIVNDQRFTVTVPTRSILKAISGPGDGGQMVNVLWEDRHVRMFAVDLITRGTEIPDRSAKAVMSIPHR